MSEHSVEDEMRAEMRTFSAAMRAAISRHAQAANWLERRKARKEISRLVRTERREADHARAQHKAWTSQAVNRYRIHAQAVALRGIDPRVDHTRRAHDAQALAEHRADLARMFVTNGHLTTTERGIALDGLDAATVFPEFKTGDLFSRAHKVKGIEALRYRAQVARTQQELGIDREADDHPRRPHTTDAARGQDSAEWELGLAQARAANRERALLNQIDRAQPEQDRYRAQLSWINRDGKPDITTNAFATEHTATSWMAREIGHSMWSEGTTVRAHIVDAHHPDRPLYTDSGRPETVAEQLEDRENTLRERIFAGRVHRDEPAAERPAAESVTSVQAATESGQLRQELEAVKQRHELSIEHNGALTDQNAQLTRQLTEMTAERDRLRGERDEAVQKLAQRTPAEQRYGSPERQAEHAKNTAAARSPLAGHRPGAALAEAVARNGHDREDLER